MKNLFYCIDGHTCGDPVRMVVAGAPQLDGSSMMERRAHFLAEYDWVRTGLMFEPRGHSGMSGSIIYAPTRSDCDVALLYIETSGCLPMCGHGTIGTVTMGIEQGFIRPRTPGVVRIDTPAGLVVAAYDQDGDYVDEVRITNVPAYLHASGLDVDCPGLGALKVDVAFGGNYYAIVEPQEHYSDMAAYGVAELIAWGVAIRSHLNEAHVFQHPDDPRIEGVTHVLWTGTPRTTGATARNAVIFSHNGIARGPCGTGTSARMAQLHAQGRLAAHDPFVHESILGATFTGRCLSETAVGSYPAIVTSIGGWARMTGQNTILIEDRDPFARGISLT